MAKASKKIITKRIHQRKINRLIDKFNSETNETKRIKILDQLGNYE